MMKDGEEKESKVIDRLDLRDKGQPVFEVCRGLRGVSQGVRMRPSTTSRRT